MINLRHLRTLQEVAERGGVGAAATALHFTPSAVSQQLAALQAELGVEVIERVGRGVRLTAAGEVLLAHGQQVLAAEAVARAAVEHARSEGLVRLRVGVFASVAAGLMPALVEDLALTTPHLRLATREIDLELARTDLVRGRLDAAFVLDYPDAAESWSPGLELSYIGTDRFSVALPRGLHREFAPVPLADLAEHDWIVAGTATYVGRAVRAACRRAGFEPRVVHQVDEQSTALALVGAGLGVTLVSDFGRLSPPAGVQVLPLAERVSRSLLVAHVSAQSQRPALVQLIEAARRSMAKVHEAPLVDVSTISAQTGDKADDLT